MSNSEKIQFIDKVVDTLSKICPEMSDNVKFFVGCQFALESNFGKSQLAVKNFNFCGMKRPEIRLTLANNVNGVFARFDSFETCVLDYVIWLSWNRFTSYDVFQLDYFTAKLIARGYCPEKDYLDKIYSIYNNLKSYHHGKN